MNNIGLKIEIPTNQFQKEQLKKKYGVKTDRELKRAIYQDFLRKERLKRDGVIK